MLLPGFHSRINPPSKVFLLRFESNQSCNGLYSLTAFSDG